MTRVAEMASMVDELRPQLFRSFKEMGIRSFWDLNPNKIRWDEGFGKFYFNLRN